MKVLLKGLPPEAAVFRNDPELGGWSRLEQLMALNIEVMDAVGWRIVTPHMKKGARLPKLVSIERPGKRKVDRRRGGVADLAKLGAGVHLDQSSHT